ncbi:hypothetical protein AX774_g1736 [Zancudomyces culisetae]|uniref:Uncharacterized protein n=1 Tax=Zancudomyces culisetae TaxID=1213189 RepID=A0A1R1PUS3_ZANCU|nr:hypothetical protein AX774_g1736 [Zancudomyces culisetae]|eukprot:OMH84728.1 hypothetical protein AX774_g1736 [Zancudomyces culisetae]
MSLGLTYSIPQYYIPGTNDQIVHSMNTPVDANGIAQPNPATNGVSKDSTFVGTSIPIPNASSETCQVNLKVTVVPEAPKNPSEPYSNVKSASQYTTTLVPVSQSQNESKSNNIYVVDGKNKTVAVLDQGEINQAIQDAIGETLTTQPDMNNSISPLSNNNSDSQVFYGTAIYPARPEENYAAESTITSTQVNAEYPTQDSQQTFVYSTSQYAYQKNIEMPSTNTVSEKGVKIVFNTTVPNTNSTIATPTQVTTEPEYQIPNATTVSSQGYIPNVLSIDTSSTSPSQETPIQNATVILVNGGRNNTTTTTNEPNTQVVATPNNHTYVSLNPNEFNQFMTGIQNIQNAKQHMSTEITQVTDTLNSTDIVPQGTNVVQVAKPYTSTVNQVTQGTSTLNITVVTKKEGIIIYRNEREYALPQQQIDYLRKQNAAIEIEQLQAANMLSIVPASFNYKLRLNLYIQPSDSSNSSANTPSLTGTEVVYIDPGSANSNNYLAEQYQVPVLITSDTETNDVTGPLSNLTVIISLNNEEILNESRTYFAPPNSDPNKYYGVNDPKIVIPIYGYKSAETGSESEALQKRQLLGQVASSLFSNYPNAPPPGSPNFQGVFTQNGNLVPVNPNNNNLSPQTNVNLHRLAELVSDAIVKSGATPGSTQGISSSAASSTNQQSLLSELLASTPTPESLQFNSLLLSLLTQLGISPGSSTTPSTPSTPINTSTTGTTNTSGLLSPSLSGQQLQQQSPSSQLVTNSGTFGQNMREPLDGISSSTFGSLTQPRATMRSGTGSGTEMATETNRAINGGSSSGIASIISGLGPVLGTEGMNMQTTNPLTPAINANGMDTITLTGSRPSTTNTGTGTGRPNAVIFLLKIKPKSTGGSGISSFNTNTNTSMNKNTNTGSMPILSLYPSITSPTGGSTGGGVSGSGTLGTTGTENISTTTGAANAM